MSNQVNELYEFGPYRLDVTRRVFTRHGQLVPLAPKTFNLLLFLFGAPAGRCRNRS
jgi:DNA-binding response OmpR family regulator